MSGKVSGWVWDQELPVHLKYILLAYADHADHEGYNVFPSRRLIAQKAGLDPRTVRRSAAELEELGFLIDDGRGPKGTRKFRIPIEGVTPTPPPKSEGVTPADVGGDAGDREGVAPDAEGMTSAPPEPSLEPSEETSMNRDQFSKNDQTPLALAKAAILVDLNGGKMYARKPEIFKLVFEPLRIDAIVRSTDGEPALVRLTHPKPEIFDSRLNAMLASALIGVFGEAVNVTIEESDA